MEEFNQKGFPIVKLHDDCFEIKAIDYYHNTEKWWSIIRGLTSSSEPHKLKIIKGNGADWTYNTPSKYSKEFAYLLREIINRSGLNQKIKSY